MARKVFGPRKRRTREHVIADLGVNHVERFIITPARKRLTSLKRQRREFPSLALQACEDISCRSNIEEGHTAQVMEKDYGYDLLLFTYDEKGYSEPDFLSLQVKAADSLQAVRSDYVFDLDIRDYNLWMLERVPVILILFDASRKRVCWLAIQGYFRQDSSRQPKKGAKTVQVHIPMRQVVNRRAIAKMRDLKWEARRWPPGEEP